MLRNVNQRDKRMIEIETASTEHFGEQRIESCWGQLRSSRKGPRCWFGFRETVDNKRNINKRDKSRRERD